MPTDPETRRRLPAWIPEAIGIAVFVAVLIFESTGQWDVPDRAWLILSMLIFGPEAARRFPGGKPPRAAG